MGLRHTHESVANLLILAFTLQVCSLVLVFSAPLILFYDKETTVSELIFGYLCLQITAMCMLVHIPEFVYTETRAGRQVRLV